MDKYYRPLGLQRAAWAMRDRVSSSHRHAVRVLRLSLVALVATSACAQTMPTPGQVARKIVFEPSPLAKNSVLLERLLSPRQRQRELAALAAKGEALAPYPLDFSAEHFSIYLPKHEPPAGYGLLVFIPPWQNARVPMGWAPVLEREGIIFATAERSGNDESIMGRRIPLALTAAHALVERYRVDPDRTFVSGFSGGSRVAFRTAIAFPDVFAGALLDSGSDPVGTPYNPLPSPDLLALLQSRTRFVFVSGENDELNVSKDAQARISLSAWCIEATQAINPPRTGHEIMNGNGLAEALGTLARPYARDPAKHSRCLSSLDAKLQQARTDAAALSAEPPSARAQQQLDRLDGEYGALLDGETIRALPAPD
jgi:predicted esterase